NGSNKIAKVDRVSIGNGLIEASISVCQQLFGKLALNRQHGYPEWGRFTLQGDARLAHNLKLDTLAAESDQPTNSVLVGPEVAQRFHIGTKTGRSAILPNCAAKFAIPINIGAEEINV